MDVDGISVARALEIENASIVSGLINSSGFLVLTNAGGTDFNAGQAVKSPQIDVYTTVVGLTIWTKPANAVLVHVMCVGGGGGGSGSKIHAGPGWAAGAGGGGGGFNEAFVPAAALPATVSVSVGAGGTAGAIATAGLLGGESYMHDVTKADGGAGGLVSTGVGVASVPGAGGNIFGGPGAPGSITNLFNPPSPADAIRGGGGGGGGFLGSGTHGNVPGGYSGGGANYGPTNSVDFYLRRIAGPGGSGGGIQPTTPAAKPGLVGSLYGGGGGGGGISTSPSEAAAGGAGAPGIVVVITYF